jgi:hypothetical protein
MEQAGSQRRHLRDRAQGAEEQPNGNTLYLKLRDDPSTVVTASVPTVNPQAY